MILPTIDRSAFSKMQFCHPWRTYQQKVLQDLDHFLTDDRVHLVAPPGAGKTVLGLEIVRRIGRPALILAPNLTIREQWTQRLRSDFLANDVRPAWISHDLRRPALITIVTYQAMYQLAEREPAAIAQLSCIKTLVADECHHLRREWWRVLQNFRMRHDPVLIALTATPPYDVNSAEWRRYHHFCGEIDAEISIPELVAAGDLCAHQDYVWPVLPTTDEREAWQQFQHHRAAFMDDLRDHRALALELLAHPYLQQPEQHWDAIYERPAYFTSLLMMLRLYGSEPPVAALAVLHDEYTALPTLNWEWLNIFFQNALQNDPYLMAQRGKEILGPLKRKLQRLGALEKSRVELREPLYLAKKLASSKAKMQGVIDIIALEHEAMRDDLRMVILTDYIRSEVLPTSPHDVSELDRMGAVPIFEWVRRSGQSLPLPCLLTGSLVILPNVLIPHLIRLAEQELAHYPGIKTQPLVGAPVFSIIETNTTSAKKLVSWITQLFGEGHIKLIIGTKSLLGEGWDAPQMNTLLLANTVGSYVLSNQMRGRAIRSQKAFPKATANIWHLFTFQPEAEDGGPDLVKLKRRFRAFAGPNLVGPPLIMNNVERFPRKLAELKEEEVVPFQENMRLYARSRAGLAQRWQEALQNGVELVEAIQPPQNYQKRQDGLSRYYHQHLTRFLPQTLQEFRQQYWLSWGIALFLSLMLHYFNGVSIALVAGLGLGLGVLAYWKQQEWRPRLGLLQENKKWRAHLKSSILPIGLLIVTTILFYSWQPLLALFFLLLVTTLSTGLLGQYGRQRAAKAYRQFSALGNTKAFLQLTANALIQALIQSNQLTPNQHEHLRIEEDATGFPICYLAQTNRYQAELFSDALRELLAPVDNPRYLLAMRLEADAKDAFYFPVPQTLARRKADAALLRDALARLGNHVDLVYTRTPLGRRILLRNRLQWATATEQNTPKAERIWR